MICYSRMPRQSRSTLFPYTTLFRSSFRAPLLPGRPAGIKAADGAVGTVRRTFRRRLDGEVPHRTICRFEDRKSTRLNSSHVRISYAVFCLKKKTYDIYRDAPFRLVH